MTLDENDEVVSETEPIISEKVIGQQETGPYLATTGRTRNNLFITDKYQSLIEEREALWHSYDSSNQYADELRKLSNRIVAEAGNSDAGPLRDSNNVPVEIELAVEGVKKELAREETLKQALDERRADIARLKLQSQIVIVIAIIVLLLLLYAGGMSIGLF